MYIRRPPEWAPRAAPLTPQLALQARLQKPQEASHAQLVWQLQWRAERWQGGLQQMRGTNQVWAAPTTGMR